MTDPIPAPRLGEPYLLTPGPLTTAYEVKQAMLRDWGSWDDEFRAMTAEIRRRLLAMIGPGATDYDCVPVLCAIVGRLSKDKREKLFFHKNRKMGRRLEAWWEDHEEKDRKRRDRERAEREREKLVDAAMTKLSSSELSALRRFFREDLG